mmetsp:Transcript_4631/g.13815  ORF Transcript_4631/g.13815 Transcript_4631/m.13815 type:complete len:563 (+) Transcript_4631:45-1733(+)
MKVMGFFRPRNSGLWCSYFHLSPPRGALVEEVLDLLLPHHNVGPHVPPPLLDEAVLREEDGHVLPGTAPAVLGHLIHRVPEELLHDAPQAPGARLPLVRLLGDLVEGLVGHVQGAPVHPEEGRVLLQDGVLRRLDDVHELLLGQGLQGSEDGEAAHELGDEAVVDHVHVLHLLGHLGGEVDRVLAVLLLHRGPEPDGGLAHPLVDHLLEANEGPAADEQDVLRVHLDVLHPRVLLVPLLRDVHDGPLEHLEQGLLDPLPAHVPGRGVPGPLRDLVDFVYVHNAPLREVEVVPRRLQQLGQDVLDVFPHVTGLGERRGVRKDQGDVHHLGQGLRQQRLSRPRWPEHQDVGLLGLHLLVVEARPEPALDAGLLLVAELLRALWAVLTRGGGQGPVRSLLVGERVAHADVLLGDVGRVAHGRHAGRRVRGVRAVPVRRRPVAVDAAPRVLPLAPPGGGRGARGPSGVRQVLERAPPVGRRELAPAVRPVPIPRAHQAQLPRLPPAVVLPGRGLLPPVLQPYSLVVVVHRHAQHLLRLLLADHVLVQDPKHLARRRKVLVRANPVA